LSNKLEVKNISKTIKKTQILSNVSFCVESKEVVGILGPNGAGKTTSFYSVCGLISIDNGQILLDGEDISHLPLHQRARKGIGYLAQESSIFSDLSVEDNILLAAEIGIESKREQTKKLEHLLDIFNIEPIRKRKGINLSGGERRRVELARALVLSPKFLLLDEPFAGVDPIAVKDIQDIIKQLINTNIGILITDHSVRELLEICSRVYVMKSGSVLASGLPEQIKQNELVKEHYLGEDFKI